MAVTIDSVIRELLDPGSRCSSSPEAVAGTAAADDDAEAAELLAKGELSASFSGVDLPVLSELPLGVEGPVTVRLARASSEKALTEAGLPTMTLCGRVPLNETRDRGGSAVYITL